MVKLFRFYGRSLRIFLALLMFPRISSAEPFNGSVYHVEAGDVLSINIALRGSLADLSKLSIGMPIEIVGESVYSHRTVTVTPDGFVFLPGLPPLEVRGQTLRGIQTAIASQLRLPTDQRFVSVALVRTNNLAFHVWGEVKNPGRYLIDHPTSLMEALANAGGPTTQAKLTQVVLMRPGEPVREFNLSVKQIRRTGIPDVMINPSDTISISKKWTLNEIVVILLMTAISTASAAYVAVKTH